MSWSRSQSAEKSRWHGIFRQTPAYDVMTVRIMNIIWLRQRGVAVDAPEVVLRRLRHCDDCPTPTTATIAPIASLRQSRHPQQTHSNEHVPKRLSFVPPGETLREVWTGRTIRIADASEQPMHPQLLRFYDPYIVLRQFKLLADESSVIAAIRAILQQNLMNGSNGLEQFESVYEQLKSSTETAQQTRSWFPYVSLPRRWMLYLLMTLYYQNKSISLSSFTIPKVRLQPTPDVGSVMISHVDPRQGHSLSQTRSSTGPRLSLSSGMRPFLHWSDRSRSPS